MFIQLIRHYSKVSTTGSIPKFFRVYIFPQIFLHNLDQSPEATRRNSKCMGDNTRCRDKMHVQDDHSMKETNLSHSFTQSKGF